jgi:hypothetical protein
VLRRIYHILLESVLRETETSGENEVDSQPSQFQISVNGDCLSQVIGKTFRYTEGETLETPPPLLIDMQVGINNRARSHHKNQQTVVDTVTLRSLVQYPSFTEKSHSLKLRTLPDTSHQGLGFVKRVIHPELKG